MRFKYASEFQGTSAADLLIRQLARAKLTAKQEKRKFSYGDLKKVYTVVLIEESTAIYWKHPNEYVHRGKQTFDTGLKLDLLQEFILIPLEERRRNEELQAKLAAVLKQ